MTAAPYLARFGSTAGEFFAAVCVWPLRSGPPLSPAWWRVLRANAATDVALRITRGGDARVVLLLTADREQALQSLVTALAAAEPITGMKQAVDAIEFDSLSRLTPLHQHLRVDHEGYKYNGQPLGCDFRLFPEWIGQSLSDEVAYQVVLRFAPTNSDDERRVRKYLAWLALEEPYTSRIREVQTIICRRLLAPGWLADEYLLFSTNEQREEWRKRIRTHFMETTGRIGFSEAPIEIGDFSDFLTTGCHSARDGRVLSAVPVRAAYTFGDDDAAWLTKWRLDSLEPHPEGDTPDIFISYASGDFSFADATRRHLEGAGWRCWIAPRDINTGRLPYTEAIPRAIEKVRAALVIISPSANVSVHIPRELDLALERRVPIIPLRLVNITPAGQLEYLLRTCQWLDVFGREYDDVMSELSNRLRNLRN